MICLKCLKCTVCILTLKLFKFSIHNLGGGRCLQPLNTRIFNYAMGLAALPPPPYDQEFFDMCNMLVKHVYHMDLCNISHANCFEIYKYLVNNIR